jgi:thiol-disulfide isomerase/thioredoxin
MRGLALWVVCFLMLACADDGGGNGDTGPSDGCEEDCLSCSGNGTEVGQKLGEMSLGDCVGETVNLSDSLCGDKKLALIYMASGWCQPCREKQPTLQKWYDTYGADGLQVMVILPEDNTTDPATKTFCQQWATDYDLSFPVTIDPTKEWSGQFLTGGAQYPVVMLVDSEWNILYKQTGANDPDMENLIQAYLYQ